MKYEERVICFCVVVANVSWTRKFEVRAQAIEVPCDGSSDKGTPDLQHHTLIPGLVGVKRHIQSRRLFERVEVGFGERWRQSDIAEPGLHPNRPSHLPSDNQESIDACISHPSHLISVPVA
ncbi:hypothetical protein Bbelb_188190 [Branchiostoma belcheri]|nr:hypothetical protein Bbelb_188190 [Branchiostoma belcheri]